MSLKPWEPGYVPPRRLTEEELAEKRRQNCALGGLNKVANIERVANGEERQYGEKTTTTMNNGVARDLGIGTRNGPDPESATSKRVARLTSENLRPDQIEMVNAFVAAYLRCFDAPQAFIMAGGKPKSATNRGYEMLRWPATQERLQAAVEALEEEQLLTRKGILMGLLKEANYHGHDSSHGSRVRAWMGLARIKKMDVQVTENHHTVRGGVMLIPVGPQTDTIDGWAQVVADDQARLKEEVRK
ncbi:hypothetical protein GUH47_18140 [Xanthomonas citri pv. citri]|nr:terminase small subunit [Achromobacter phage vB_Ade_ART]MBD4207874.1 hypothetical protein [Xanthomonas citri pv. citri]